MTQPLLPSGRLAGAVAPCATTALILALQPANTRIIAIDIKAAALP